MRDGDSGRGFGGQMKRRIFNLLAAVSLVLCAGTIVGWIWSYFVTTPASNAATGYSKVAPPFPIPYPVLSEAEEYVVPTHGWFERWEYTPWDGKWYQYGISFPIALPVLAL